MTALDSTGQHPAVLTVGTLGVGTLGVGTVLAVPRVIVGVPGVYAVAVSSPSCVCSRIGGEFRPPNRPTDPFQPDRPFMARSLNIEFDTQLLRTLHRLQRRRFDLNGRIERCPRQVKAGEAMVNDAAAKLAAATAALKTARMACDEKQLQLKTREDHVANLGAKLNVAASNKEFTLLKEQIAADEQANSVQSDEIFEGLETIDALAIKVAAAAEELAQQQREHAERVKEVKEKEDRLRAELAGVEAERETEEAKIPAATKEDYIRLTAAKGEDAMAAVEDDSCGCCRQTLTAQVVNQVMLQTLTYCPNCNAYLYIAEDQRVR